ncbi:hypothetical protein BDV97DRAFT_354054 [Delphinella strobiligena]|nr:hypothetical protein BDV97DRAFT_354054 [Delphinella strobiligena]
MLVDVQNAHNNKARPDRLQLKDDSQFMLDNLFNFDSAFDHDLTTSGTSDLDSLLSPRTIISSTLGSEHDDLGAIVIPPDSSSLGGAGGFSLAGSVQGGSGRGSRMESSMFRRAEQEHLFDPGFAFDDEGNLIDSNPAGAEEAIIQPDLPSLRDPAVLTENAGADVDMRADDILDHHPDDDAFPRQEDDYDLYGSAQAFTPRHRQSTQFPSSTGLQSRHGTEATRKTQSAGPIEPGSDAVTEEAVTAPAVRIKKKKALAPDTELELHNHNLSAWSDNYLVEMQSVLRGKIHTRSVGMAKKNADFWVLQNGVNGLSMTFGQESIPEPLRMFTGTALLEALTGLRPTNTAGEKRPREEGEEEEEEAEAGTDDDGRRVRARSNESGMGLGDGDVMMEDAGYIADQNDYIREDTADEPRDENIEVGREAQTPLTEHATSIMPWNSTASIRGSSARPGSRAPFSVGRFTTSFAGGAPIGGLERMSSRMVSASPSRGRGTDALTQQPMGMDLGTALRDNSQGVHVQDHHQSAAVGLDANEQFEVFGPAAVVATQQANHPGWVRQALDTQSINFLSFVQTSIEDADKARAMPSHAEDAEEHIADHRGSILFEDLLVPTENSAIVAAQGLLHVLTLATKNLLSASQATAFGSIDLRVLAIANAPVPVTASGVVV